MKGLWPTISRLSLCGTLVVVASCQATRPPTPTAVGPARALEDIYRDARRDGMGAAADMLQRDLQMHGTLGYLRPYVPVRTPPQAMPVWIPSFVDEDNHLIQGHWVHILITDEQWFIETALPREIPEGGRIPHHATNGQQRERR